MTDLDSQLNATTSIRSLSRSDQPQEQILSSHEGDSSESEESTYESTTDDSITISDNELSPQQPSCSPKDKVTVIPFPKRYTVRLIENVEITPGIIHFKSASTQTTQDSNSMEPSNNILPASPPETQQRSLQVNSASVLAITASCQGKKPEMSTNATKEAKTKCNPAAKPIPGRVMTAMMEEFMEHQEQKEIGSSKDFEATKQTNSEISLDKTVVSTGYCIIEKKVPEEHVVNVNVVSAQNSSCSPIVRIGSGESSAKSTARLTQRKDKTSVDNSQDHSVLSTEE